MMAEVQTVDMEADEDLVKNSNFTEQSTKLFYSDYDVPCFSLAKNLLGLQLCRRLDSGKVVKGIIVETECYPGGDDKASQSFGGKKTERNAPMFMSPGTAYIYMTYGMYHCFNISSRGVGAAVLIRAVEPTFGLEELKKNRGRSFKGKSVDKRKKSFSAFDLGSGPSKLCMSFDIDRSLNKEDMVKSMKLWVERPSQLHSENKVKAVVACARIGIDSVGIEWASKPYRFYIMGNAYVSKRDKKAEENNVFSI